MASSSVRNPKIKLRGTPRNAASGWLEIQRYTTQRSRMHETSNLTVALVRRSFLEYSGEMK
jgi:hypothetical protein